jgi:hypothetical protein
LGAKHPVPLVRVVRGIPADRGLENGVEVRRKNLWSAAVTPLFLPSFPRKKGGVQAPHSKNLTLWLWSD